MKNANPVKPRVLFISDKTFVDYIIPGGVQVCTAEFLEYFNEAGYVVDLFKIEPNITVKQRISIRLGIEVYDRYNFKKYINSLLRVIQENDIRLVAFNQLNLTGIVPLIKSKLPSSVKFIGLSHGNESGDFLHDVATNKRPGLLQKWRLGSLLLKENLIFRNYLDAVIAISEQEVAINQWIGVGNSFFLPRMLSAKFLKWKPVDKRIGFVGTLNHLPNYEGLKLVALHLEEQNFTGELRLVGGPEQIGLDFENKFSFIKYVGKLDDQNLENECASWALFLNPVFWYSRGSSTKLAQAINWGLPVISTPAGARGYVLEDRNFLTMKNSPEEFTKMLINAINSGPRPDKLKQISEANASKFDRSLWGGNLKEFLDSL